MKRRSLKLLGLTSLLFSLCSLPVLVDKKEVTEVSAAQHAANFDEYDYKSYNGSYYSFVPSNPTEGLDGTLRTTLTSNILPKQWYSYSGSGETTLSSILQQADEDPTNSSNMIYLYTRDSVKKNPASTSSWNREHTWPKSLSGGCWEENKAGTDILHLRPTYQTPNSTRSNNKFAEISGGTKKTYNGMDYGYLSGSNFMPLDSVKGDVARVIMYVWVAYKNYYGNLPAITNVFQSYDTLLKWHTQDKPDVMEAHRNDVAENSLQKNRNPFVDHPEYAWQIFGNSCSASIKDACKSAYPLGGGGGGGTTTTKTLTSLSQSGTLSKTTYTVGESFNPSGLTITANFSDGSSNNVTNQIEWSANTSSAGQNTVTGSYTYEGTTKQITLTITVINSDAGTKTLVSIETNGECKTIYTVGETFVPTGLEIIAHYSDGSSQDVTNQISWDADTSIAGEGTAIGQYTFGSSFQTVQININIVENPSPIIDDGDPPVVDDNPPVDEKEQGLAENLLGNLPGADLFKKFGCSANLSSTSIIIFASSVLGVALICFFKKKGKTKIK